MSDGKEKKVNIAGGQAFDLAAMIDYGEGAIVSRTLIDGDAGTVTLFAFAEGQDLSEHTAPFDALVQVLEGTGEFVVDGETSLAAAGQIFLMPADIPHAVRAKGCFKMLLTMLRK